ncbi:GxxExxY protein [bacterium]|nr:GxxExxY protein [bacterium]
MNQVSGAIVDAAVHVHRQLGPGLLESVYLAVLAHELRKRGFRVQTEVAIPVRYESVVMEQGFRADMIVEDSVIVELKSVEELARVHPKQLLTYLRLSDKKVGLLINFGSSLLKDGIIRMVNGLPESPA